MESAIIRYQKDMSNIVHPKLPWLTFIFTTIVFFLLEHDFFHSIRWQTYGLNKAKEMVEMINEGSLIRRIALLFFGGFAVINLIRKKRYDLKITGFYSLLFVFFLVWCCSSILWADSHILAVRKIIVLMIFFVSAIYFAKRFSIRQIIIFLLFSCSLFLAAGICAEIGLRTFHPFQSSYRFCGTSDPNGGSLDLSLLVMSSIFLATIYKSRRKLLFPLAFISFSFLILSKTRTSFAAIILSFVVYLLLASMKTYKKVAGILIICSLFFTLFLDLVSKDRLAKGAQEVLLLGRGNSSIFILSGRIPTWRECLLHIKEHPFFGHGYNAFWTPERVLSISARSKWASAGVGQALNGYIDLALGVGLIGVGIFVLLLFTSFRKYVYLYKKNNSPEYAFAFISICYYAIVMLLESVNLSSGMLGFIIFILMAKLFLRYPSREKKETN